jgi:hypothetical protein
VCVTSEYNLLGHHSVSIDVGAPSEVVYELVADITGTPKMSRECRRTEWLGAPGRPELGARFRGQNRWRGIRWWRTCQITRAERGRGFEFVTLPGRAFYNDTTTWRYEFEPSAIGTRVTQTYEFSGPRWIGLLDRLIGRPMALERNVWRSLQMLKQAAEAEAV